MTLGLKDLYYAKVTMQDGVENYGEPKKLAEALNADLSVNVAEAKLYADDALSESAKEFVDGALKLGIKELTPEVIADILGQETDDDGVVWAGDDEAPFVAVGFRAAKMGGKYKYVWLQKVQFKVPGEKYTTKGESITFNTGEIEGTIYKAKASGKWKADYVGDPSSAEDTVAANWFKSVRTYTKTA